MVQVSRISVFTLQLWVHVLCRVRMVPTVFGGITFRSWIEALVVVICNFLSNVLLNQREVNTECCEFVKYRQFVFSLIMCMFTRYFRVASVTLGCNCFFKLIKWLMHYDILHYLQFINGRICVSLMVAWITEFLFT